MQPRELGNRERRHRHAAARRSPIGSTARQLLEQPAGIGCRLGVVPQFRIANDRTNAVERDHAVLLASHADCPHRGSANVLPCPLERRPP